jgi:tetratricopeptide (TPR) repeat protein
VSLEELIVAADTLLRLGAPARAGELLDLAAGRSAPDGERLLRAGLCALAAGDLERAESELDRAEPFLSAGVAAVARVQLASRRGDWSAVADTLAGLGDDGPAGSTRVAALAALLRTDPERALELCAADPDPQGILPVLIAILARHAGGLEPAPPPAFGAGSARSTSEFLLGAPGARRSPLHAAALLLALETPGFQAFAAHELRRLAVAYPTNPWPVVLEAEACRRLGAQAEAELLLSDVTARQSAFTPAWDLLEQAVRERVRAPDHPQLTLVRESRLLSSARARPDSPEAMVLLSRKDRAEGHPKRAQNVALSSLAVRPDWAEGLAEVARAASDLGDHNQAVTAWREVLLDRSPHVARPFVPDFLRALAIAAADPGSGLTPGAHERVLKEVADQLPHDPRLALARARLALSAEPDNPALGTARAFGRLDAFLAAHPDTTLESLQPGSSEDWAEFYVAIDPEVAQAFLRSQREREPGNLELWLQLGRVLQSSGEIDGAAQTLLRVTRISPDPRPRLALARSTISRCLPPRAIQGLVGPGVRPTDPDQALESQLIWARGLLRQVTRNSWVNAALSLAEPWARHDRVEDPGLRSELGELYATALLARGQVGDADAALVALDLALEDCDDPYRRAYLAALSGLARVGHGERAP